VNRSHTFRLRNPQSRPQLILNLVIATALEMYGRRSILGLAVILGCVTFVFYYVYHSSSIDCRLRNNSYQEKKTVEKLTVERPTSKLPNNNIYFSIKTTERNYEERLMLLMTTWFEVLENKVVRDFFPRFRWIATPALASQSHIT